MRKLFPLLFLAVALAGCGSSGSSSTAVGAGGGQGGPKEYTLAINVKEGDTYKYSMDMEQGANQKVTMGMTMSVAKVEAEKITTHMKIDSMAMNGTAAPATFLDPLKKMTVVTEMDKRGKTISTKTEGAPAGAGSESPTNGVPFPDRPVKIGDTWEGEGTVGNEKVNTTYKLVKVDSVGGKNIGTIEATPGPIKDVTVKTPMVFTVDMTTGMPESMTFEAESKGETAKISMKRV